MNIIKEQLAKEYAELMGYEKVGNGYKTRRGYMLTTKEIVKTMDEWKFFKRGTNRGDKAWMLDMERIKRVNSEHFKVVK